MDLATVFKLSLYGLTALVGWILGAAEGGWLPYGSLPVVIAGYWWSEGPAGRGRSRTRGMGETLASICGFIALSAAGNEFFGDHPEGKLLSGTHLVLYLTWIVLLQRKTTYRYWLLLALGVLQVAVASVLQPGSWFGLCVIGYVFAAIWTMSVFSLYRAEEQFAAERPIETSAPPAAEKRSQSFGGVQHEDGEHWLSMRFASGVVFTSVLGLFVGAVFFALIPRVWVGSPMSFGDEDIPGVRRRSVTGFASTVRLGDMGPILESLDPVLELKLFDHRTGQPMLPQTYAERLSLAEPLFRGAVLSSYRNGVWKPDRMTELGPQRLHPAPEQAGVRQEIRLEPIGNDVLFCMGRAVALSDERGQASGRHQWITDVAYRSPDFPKTGAVRYTVYSELPSSAGRGAIGLEVPAPVRFRYSAISYLDRNLEIPEGLNRIVDLARQVVADEGRQRGRRLTDLETARALEVHLRDSGQYRYSTNLSIQDPMIDPVEDFLFNRHSGHCEYFASALALMLRSAGVPARLVTGYKGGLYHAATQSFRVQQCYSHAWVEAWIDGRTWVTVDGTPPDSRAESIAAVGANRSVWTDVRSRLSGMWTENVVNISLDRQEEAFYRPLRELVIKIWEALRALWVSPESSVESFLKLLLNPRNWFSAGGIATLLVVAAMGWLLRRLFLLLRGSWFGWHRTRADQRRRLVEFYERFARLMQSRGLRREPTQTQHEFARRAAEMLEPQLYAAGLAEGPTMISDFFYRVRFGDETLPEEEARHVDELLSRLEQALDPSRRT